MARPTPAQAKILRDAKLDLGDFQNKSMQYISRTVGEILAKRPPGSQQVRRKEREGAIQKNGFVPGMRIEIVLPPSQRPNHPVFDVIKRITDDGYVELEGRKTPQIPQRLKPVQE